MLVYVTLFACAALMVLLVRRYDLHGREPWYMVLLAVAVGIVFMWSAGRVEDAALARLRLDPGQLAAKAALVAAVEGLAKLMAVMLIAASFRRHFNDPLDGLLYGTLAGLGMAVEESLLYLSLTPDKNALALGAEVIRLFGHSLMGGLLGFAVGLVLRPARGAGRREGPRASRTAALPATCVGVALVIHFCWDYIAYRPHVPPAMRGVLMLLMLCLMLAWGAMVAYAMEHSRRFLRAGTAPVPA